MLPRSLSEPPAELPTPVRLIPEGNSYETICSYSLRHTGEYH